MLINPAKEYNEKEWINSINRMQKYDKVQFYVIPKCKVWGYDRFFCSYVADGIHFFSSFSAYSSSITNNGFCKVLIDNFTGNVSKFLFTDKNGVEGYAANGMANRALMRKHTSLVEEIMFSNDI